MKNKLKFGSETAIPREPTRMGGYRIPNEKRPSCHWFVVILRELTPPKPWSMRLIDAMRKHLRQQ
jgi:hypothetical protein